MYRFMTGSYHSSGLGDLMTISRLPYIVILKRDLLHADYEFISYLGMKSWDLQVCDRASTITHVDREKKNSAY